MALFQILRRNKGKLTEKQQLRFLNKLSSLLSNGYSLIDALNMLIYDKQLMKDASQIKESLIEGLSIADAFEKAEFDKEVTSYLFFVKYNGNIQESLKKCIYMFEKRVTYKEKFIHLIRYPVVLLLIFVILLTVIKQTILPTFLDLFQSNEDTSSLISYLILIIDFLGYSFILTFIFLLVTTISWFFIKKHIPIEQKLKIYTGIPFFRVFLKLQTTYFFATHMSMLLKTGMPIKAILQNLSEQERLPIIAYYALLMEEELANGKHYVNLLHDLPFIDEQLAQIFEERVDQTQLEKDLSTYALMLTEKIEQKVMKVMTLIQPVFFIIIGIFIVFIYGTLMWPMLQLIKSV